MQFSNGRNIEKKVENKNTDFQDIEVVDSTDLASFDDDKMLEVPLEAEEKSIVRSTLDNNTSVQGKSFDNSENISRNSQAYEAIDEEPLLSREKINENNLFDEVKDESLYDTQPTFNTREISNSSNNRNSSSAGERLSYLSQSSATPKNEGNIEISLIGRVQVHGGFNQTPMLISFDAIPDGSSVTQSSVSTGLSNTIKAIETTAINLPLNDSNVESTFDLLSMSELANDGASNSLNMTSDDSREAEKTNEIGVKSREKLFRLTRRSGEERKTAKKNSSRKEKRLDKYNTNSRSAVQIFLTDYSVESNGKGNGTNVGRVISERNGGKLDSRSSANPVYFPDILGSVNNDSLKDRDVIKEPRRRIDVPMVEANRSNSIKIDPSNMTTLHVAPLTHLSIKKSRVDFANDGRTTRTCCPCEDPRNVTLGGCYRMPMTVRKLEITEATVNDWNAVTTTSSPSTPSQNVLEIAIDCTTNETHSALSSKCKGSSINATRVRNMMAIVRFMMKLLRIIAEEEEPPFPKAQINETAIHVKTIVIDASSHAERQNTTDREVIKEKTRQDFMTLEWRSAITERIHEESSPLGDGTFESFTEVSSHPAASTLPTSSDEVSKDEGLFTLFETFTGKEVYASTLSGTTSFVTPKPFLFYEHERKPLRKDASRKNTRVELTGVKQNPNVSFKGSKDESRGEKSRLDGSQTNRSPSWPRDQDRSSVDRLHFGKQGIASTTNPGDKVGSLQEKYLARSKNVGFRRSEAKAANDTVRPTFPRDIDVSLNALLEGIGAARKIRLERSKKSGVSDRRAERRTKLFKRSTKGGPPGDWIGEHRAATRLSIDKKLRKSCKVPGGTATPGKVVFRRVRGEINRPPDPNLVSGRSDSFKIEGNVVGNGSLAKLSTDDAPAAVDGRLSSLEREDTWRNPIRYSTSSLTNDNVGAPTIGREIADEHMRSVAM